MIAICYVKGALLSEIHVVKQAQARRGQRQAKIMIAKKMGMTIRGTSQAAMVLILRSLMVRLQRRHAYMEKARACRAIIEKYALST
jgi:hypothetical protein